MKANFLFEEIYFNFCASSLTFLPNELKVAFMFSFTEICVLSALKNSFSSDKMLPFWFTFDK